MPRRRTATTTDGPRGELVQFVPPEAAEADYDQLADTLLAVADEVAAAEDRIKREAVAAIECGDYDGARELLERWLVEPPVDIVASLREGGRCG